MSRLPFELFLALRYLRPKRTFVSVITLISVIGVMLGVAVLIVVISVMTGFDHQLRDTLTGFGAHLTVARYENEPLSDYPSVMAVVQSNANVKAVTPFIVGPVMMQTQPSTGKPMFRAPWMRGIDPELEKDVTSISTNILPGGEFNLEGDSIIVGSQLARDLHISVGDRVSIYSPRHLEEMEQQRRKKEDVSILPDDYLVRGIFDLGYYEYDANLIVASLASAQNLYQLPGKVHGLMAVLRDPYQAEKVRGQIYPALGPEYRISIWTEENSRILSALAVEKNVMYYLLIFIVIVAAFGIMNSQITFVMQKTREIGTLMALGASRGQIMWVFLGQSLVVGTIGVLAGLGLGLVAVESRNSFLHFMRRVTNLELFPAQIYGFSDLPALMDPRDIGFICISALVICGLAGLAPAVSAGGLKPVEALRHE